MTKLSDLAKRAGNLPIIDQLREGQAIEQKVMEIVNAYRALRKLILEASIDDLVEKPKSLEEKAARRDVERTDYGRLYLRRQDQKIARQRALLAKVIDQSSLSANEFGCVILDIKAELSKREEV